MIIYLKDDIQVGVQSFTKNFLNYRKNKKKYLTIKLFVIYKGFKEKL